MIMIHVWGSSSSLHSSKVRLYRAVAVLTLAGWAGSSNAQTVDASDGKNSSTEDLQEVAVVGYKITRGSVGSLVDAPIADIPRNIVAITEQTLDDQMVGSTLDILKNWAGVQRGSDAPGGEHPRVRGMTAFQFLEGSFSGGAIWDSAEFLGAAELMTGPNSIQYGFLVQGGGAINYLLKRPASREYLEVTAQGTNWGGNKYVADGNLPFKGVDGDGLRVIAVHESIQEFRKGTEHGERNSAAAMLTYSGILGIKSELDAEILRRDAPASPTITFSANPSGPLRRIDPRDSTEQPWENIKRNGYHLGGKFSRQLVGTWRAVANISAESEEVLNKSCTLYDPDPLTGEGSYTCGTFGFQTFANRTLRLDILGSFETFGITHDVTVGVSQLRQHIRLPSSFDNFTDSPYNANNLYSPRYYPNPTVPTSQSLFNQYRETQWWTQEYFQDRIKFNDHWDLWVGANEGNNKVRLMDVTGLLATADANGVSPSFSLSFSPKDKLRFYVTYADAISPGGSAPLDPHYVNSGERFGPLRLKSTEAGVKWQVADISELNLNIFDSEQPLAYIKVLAPNSFLYTEKGKDRYTGVEFTSTSKFPIGLTLNAGLTLLKPRQVDTGDPTLNGKYVPGASRESAALYGEYRLPMVPGLGLTANVTYNSSTPLMPTNGYDIGGYTLADLGGFYRHTVGGVDVTFRMILSNAFDVRYLSPYYSSVTLGAPRTLTASVTARFGGRD
jgi:iron complex outermembrane recepter protein